MPPQSNPNWRHLEEYEQMKRKNRRRLVGALLLTAVVALLLAKVLGSDKNDAAPGEITVSGGATAASAVVENHPLPEPAADVPGAADAAVEVQAQPVSAPQEVIAEPVQPAPPPAVPAKPVDTQTAVLPNPLANSGNSGNSAAAVPPAQPRRPAPEPRAESKPAPAAPAAERRPEPRAQQAETKPAVPPPKPAAQDNARRAEADKAQQPAAQAQPPRSRQAEAKPAEAKPAERNRRAAERKPEGRQNRLSPEEILNNRAANQVSSGGKASENQAEQTEKRMVIQVGAYTSEEQARSVQKRLADAGVSAYVAAPPGKGGNALYRVRTGSYPNRQAANQALGKIKAQGLDGMLLER